jgi:hypothetical protein
MVLAIDEKEGYRPASTSLSPPSLALLAWPLSPPLAPVLALARFELAVAVEVVTTILAPVEEVLGARAQVRMVGVVLVGRE